MNKIFLRGLLLAIAANAVAQNEVNLKGADVAPIARQRVIHEVPGPGFDCRKAASRVERAICGDKALALLDKRLTNVFAQALATAADERALRRAQRRWLAQRDRCTDRACLVSAYGRRMRAMVDGGVMTNQRAVAICDEVVKTLNEGSIGARFMKFVAQDREAGERWREAHPGDHRELSGALTLTQNGRTRRLVMLSERGSCSSCTVEDSDAKEAKLYPPDDEQQRLRWAGVGACDHVLMIQGEPIVVTGKFDQGLTHASLVAWIAPDGAKRALCHLEDTAEVAAAELSGAMDPQLCGAVTEGRVDTVRWRDAPPVDGEGDPPDFRWDKVEAAQLDLDMDGTMDMVGRFVHSSGAGCGATYQSLEVLAKIARAAVETARDGDSAEPQVLGGAPVPVLPDPYYSLAEPEGAASDSYRVADTALADALRQHGFERLQRRHDSRFDSNLFEFGGRPYLLSGGQSSRARVLSLWGSEVRTWCEFDLLPQYRAEIYYPVETWPARAGR